MLCFSTSDIISIIQCGISLFVGIFTIFIYLKITKLANSNNDKLNEINKKNNLFNKLNSDLDRIVDYTIQYPYFDDLEYKSIYQNDLISDNIEKRNTALRYTAFAIMNFNFVEDLNTFYKGNEQEMEDYCDFKELILDHVNYWNTLQENEKQGYHKIITLIDNVIKESKNI